MAPGVDPTAQHCRCPVLWGWLCPVAVSFFTAVAWCLYCGFTDVDHETWRPPFFGKEAEHPPMREVPQVAALCAM